MTTNFLDDDVSPSLRERLSTALEGAKDSNEIFGLVEWAAERALYAELNALGLRYAEEYQTLDNARTLTKKSTDAVDRHMETLLQCRRHVSAAIATLLSENT